MNDITISLRFHLNLVKPETNFLSVFIKRFLYSYTFPDSFMSQGLYLPFHAHIQNTELKKKEISPHHIFPLMKLAPFRNDSKCDCVCVCMCVCVCARITGRLQ